MNHLFPVPSPASNNDEIEGRLLQLATLFLFIMAVVLTLSPAARLHEWAVSYRWMHWIGFGVWLAVFVYCHRQISRLLPDRDPYLLPLVGILTGWGLLFIWRLSPTYGMRQTIWLILGAAVLILGIRTPKVINYLQRYKYLWLVGSLILTLLTFFLGTYPGGIGPHLWLGCCGLYMQPTEPLKLLLIVYLAAYLADRLPLSLNLAQTILPSIILTGAAFLILVTQRDLGTAVLLIALFTVIFYIATGRKRIVLISTAFLLISGVAGYGLFDVVRLRVTAWLNPWLDPSGRSYQIVQSLIAFASGGILGQGPGLGNPGIVPVAHADFIYTAIGEETGLLGTTGLILILAILILRGLRIAMHSSQLYHRYLAVGITTLLTGQALLIIGGNLRLFPLTGVTLPFVSYGGSSLVTSFICLTLLFLISDQADLEPALLTNVRPYLYLGGALLAGMAAAMIFNGWWSVWQGPGLVERNDNPRRTINDLYVRRGSLLDRDGKPIDISQGSSGSFNRRYNYPRLGPVTGYTNPSFGLSGLESSLDPYLRGLQGNPASQVSWASLLYGQPPAGLDVRLSLSLSIQKKADDLLENHPGAIVLLNAQTGEILAMASHPSFDPNNLSAIWSKLIVNPQVPLLNRATQGLYSPGTILGPFFLAEAYLTKALPAIPSQLEAPFNNTLLTCTPALQSTTPEWANVVSSGCPQGILTLATSMNENDVSNLYQKLGFFETPILPLPMTQARNKTTVDKLNDYILGQEGISVTPLQMALAAAALSNQGLRPVPRLAMAVNTPQQGWVILPTSDHPVQAIPIDQAESAALTLSVNNEPLWQSVGSAQNGPGKVVTWYIGGTLPGWKGAPIAAAVVLEESNPELARTIGQSLLEATQTP